MPLRRLYRHCIGSGELFWSRPLWLALAACWFSVLLPLAAVHAAEPRTPAGSFIQVDENDHPPLDDDSPFPFADVAPSAVEPAGFSRLGVDCAWSEPSPFCPRWSARIGTLLLARTNPEASQLMFNFGSNAPVLGASGFSFPMTAAVDVAATRYGESAAVGFRYFGVNQGTATLGPAAIAAGAIVPIPGVSPLPGPASMSSSFGSTVQSAEVNVGRPLRSGMTLLAGVRYLELRDRLSIDAHLGPGNGAADFEFATRNNLFGVQVGAEGVLWSRCDCLRVEGAFKAGVFGDSAQSRFGFQAPGDAFDGRSRKGSAAFVGDLNLVGVYQITDRWAFRAGYQLLWLAGVAVASDQLTSINLNHGTVGTTSNGSALFNGVMLNLERCW